MLLAWEVSSQLHGVQTLVSSAVLVHFREVKRDLQEVTTKPNNNALILTEHTNRGTPHYTDDLRLSTLCSPGE